MNRNPRKVSANGMLLLLAAMANVVVLRDNFTSGESSYWVLLFTAPLLVYALLQARSSEL